MGGLAHLWGILGGVVGGLGGGSWEGMVEEDGAKAGDACFSRLYFGLARSLVVLELGMGFVGFILIPS